MLMQAILVVDDDPDVISALRRDLTRRYEADYRIVVERTPEATLQQLQHMREDGTDVALVIAGWHLRGMSGIDLLIAAHRIHPGTRRAHTVSGGPL